MTEVYFTLDVTTQQVAAKSSDRSESWARIRGVFSSETEHVELVGERKIQVPLWLFLVKRDALAYRLNSEEVNFNFDSNLTAVLRRVLSQSAEYDRLPSARILSAHTLQGRLKGAGFTRHLKFYQSRNVRKLLRYIAGATFSVPGAGKTTEALAYFSVSARNNEKLLVVAPKNAFSAWETQFELCFPSSRHSFTRLVGGRKQIAALLATEPRYSIVSYRQLGTVLPEILSYLSKYPVAVFLDESHRMKGGPARETGRNVLQLSGLPTRKLLLTGTPIPNSQLDLVAQAQFLFPYKEIDEGNAQSIVDPIYVRTTKAELGLRRPERITRDIQMSPAQNRFYSLIAREEARRLSKFNILDKIQLRSLGRSVMRLIQVASNPLLLINKTQIPTELLRELTAEEDSPKIQYACHRARLLARQRKKTVIWSTFVDTVELIASRLTDLGADYIHGGVDAGSDLEEDTRERKIKDFHLDDKKFVLVANPASCGEGISLHEVCHHAIYVDRNFNAGQYLQSEDRIHRLGLSKKQRTVIEILISPGSIDEAVQNRLSAKVRAMGRALNDQELNIDPISLDPETLSDDEVLDEADAQEIIDHLVSHA
ncbi:MAG: DEAD/DEAH box helicase [Candidatus Binatia bacterium]